MIKIENLILNCEVLDILLELQTQLKDNNINLLKDINDSGENVMITCPYHKDGNERRPSAGVRKSDGVFHCFTCNTVKTLPELISDCLGYNDYGVYGIQWLAKHFATVSIENRKPIDLNISREQKQEIQTYVSEEELDSYRYYHPYMYERKLTNEVIEIFDVGFDGNTNCITFNCRNKHGNSLFIARRSVTTKYFSYPKNVEKEVYGIYELYQLKNFPTKVYICESMIDALTLWTHHLYACALNGLGTELQFKQLKEMPCRHFVLATDNDSAGKLARIRLRSKLSNKLITEVILPKGRKDINECSWEEIESLQEIF